MVRRRKSMAFRKRRRKAGDGLREACEKWLKEEACGEWLQDGLSGVLCEAGESESSADSVRGEGWRILR